MAKVAKKKAPVKKAAVKKAAPKKTKPDTRKAIEKAIIGKVNVKPRDEGDFAQRMKAARAALQNGVAGNASRHHLRQRAMVRRSTGTTSLRRASRASLTPSRRMAISTTTVAT